MNHSAIVVQLFCLIPLLCSWCTMALWYPPPLVMQLSNIRQLSWCTEKFWYGGTYIFPVTKPYWEIGRLHTWHGMLSMKWKIKQRVSIGTKIYSDEHLCTWQSHLRSRLVPTQVAPPLDAWSCASIFWDWSNHWLPLDDSKFEWDDVNRARSTLYNRKGSSYCG